MAASPHFFQLVSCFPPHIVTAIYTLATAKRELPLNLSRSSSLWWWSMTSEMLFVFSQCASWSPTFTSSERVLRDATVNNNRIVVAKLLMMIFKNLNILYFVPESVIVVCCQSGTRSLWPCVYTELVRGCWMRATCWTESKHSPTGCRK